MLRGLAACLLLCWRIEQRHPISSANSTVELVYLCGHVGRRLPNSEGFSVGERSIECFTRSFDDFRVSRIGSLECRDLSPLWYSAPHLFQRPHLFQNQS